MLGWCSGYQTPASHARCPYEIVVSEGVHRGKLMVCECECHKGRKVDYSKYPEDIVRFGSVQQVEEEDEE